MMVPRICITLWILTLFSTLFRMMSRGFSWISMVFLVKSILTIILTNLRLPTTVSRISITLWILALFSAVSGLLMAMVSVLSRIPTVFFAITMVLGFVVALESFLMLAVPVLSLIPSDLQIEFLTTVFILICSNSFVVLSLISSITSQLIVSDLSDPIVSETLASILCNFSASFCLIIGKFPIPVLTPRSSSVTTSRCSVISSVVISTRALPIFPFWNSNCYKFKFSIGKPRLFCSKPCRPSGCPFRLCSFSFSNTRAICWSLRTRSLISFWSSLLGLLSRRSSLLFPTCPSWRAFAPWFLSFWFTRKGTAGKILARGLRDLEINLQWFFQILYIFCSPIPISRCCFSKTLSTLPSVSHDKTLKANLISN